MIGLICILKIDLQQCTQKHQNLYLLLEYSPKLVTYWSIKKFPTNFKALKPYRACFVLNSGTELKINIQNGWVENSQLFGN